MLPPDPNTTESREEERMLCTSCLHPNDPDTKYCRNCGAPIGPTAAWGPWEQTQAEGFAIRQATTTERPRLILVLGVWLIFFPIWLGSTLLLGITTMNTDWEFGDKLTMVVCLGFLVLSTALLYRSTVNYRLHKSPPVDDTEAWSSQVTGFLLMNPAFCIAEASGALSAERELYQHPFRASFAELFMILLGIAVVVRWFLKRKR